MTSALLYSMIKNHVVERSPAIGCPESSAQSRRAFSLMELLVVLAVIGIIAGISFDWYRSEMPRVQLRSASQQAMAMMQQARLLAIRKSQVVIIQAEQVEGKEYLVASRLPASGEFEEVRRLELPRTFGGVYLQGPPGDEADYSDLPLNVLRFGADGQVASLGGFRFASGGNPENVFEVTIPTFIGQPEIRKWLAPADRPSETGQQFYAKTAMGEGSAGKNIWVWY